MTLRADVIVLQLVAAPTEVGLYAAPASLTTAALALSMAYRPRVQAAAFSTAPLRGILRNCLQVFVLATIGTVALWLATPLIVPILFGSRFQDAVPLMRTLAFAIVPLLMVDLVFAALIVLGRQRDLLVVAAGSAALNVVALCVLCPLWGAHGAAVATVLSYSLADRVRLDGSGARHAAAGTIRLVESGFSARLDEARGTTTRQNPVDIGDVFLRCRVFLSPVHRGSANPMTLSFRETGRSSRTTSVSAGSCWTGRGGLHDTS